MQNLVGESSDLAVAAVQGTSSDGNAVVGVSHAAGAVPRPVPVGPAGSHPAVAAALAARARREEARGLAAADPRMARDLRIGRPDLPRAYDDGGLVDLNSAPPSVIADVCEIELAVATLIADARAQLPFATIDDVFSLVDIPYPLWDRIRDRAIVIAA